MTDALDQARAAQAARREAGETIVRLDPITKARNNPKSRRLAVNAHCWWCQGSGDNVNTHQLIRECENTRCPLHGVRPYQTEKRGAAALARPMKETCIACVGDTDTGVRRRVGACACTDCALWGHRPYQHLEPDAESA